jgi:outer membrane lipoprotein-sorting protein
MCTIGTAMLCGCAAERIPKYPTMSSAQALQALSERSQAIKTISAQGSITLTGTDGNSIRLDAAVVMRPPDDAHFRAWKFGQMVFDMTLSHEKTWIIAPQKDSRKEVLDAGSKTGKFARQWLTLVTGNFNGPGFNVTESGSQLLISQRQDEGAIMKCWVDRGTLTPREYALQDRAGVRRFTLLLTDYGEFNNVVWPQRIEAISDSGRILIELRDIEINGEIPDTAFHPAARAELLP